jgi:CRISPR-associated protein Csd1
MDHIGKVVENQIPLLPICHTTQNAQITITLDENGFFKRASLIPKKEASTIIPCTEESGGRAGQKPTSHPLCDKLQYIAKDYIKFGGEVTSGFAKSPHIPHQTYLELLQGWCNSPYAHPKINAVYAYVNKGTVIEDLCNAGLLPLDSFEGKLLKTWEGKEKESPPIFKLLKAPEEAFVRWDVEIGNDWMHLWNDKNVWESWSQYYNSTQRDMGLCFVTGKQLSLAKLHPAKLRHSGDKAKLISSNDTNGFTFRGRFEAAEQAYGVGFEVSQKAHNALRWLVSRQGSKFGNQAIIAWSVQGLNIPNPFADSWDLLGATEEQPTADHDAAQTFALRLNKKIKGYQAELGCTSSIVTLSIEPSTPGRMSINYYRELTSSDFLSRIETWHNDCCWMQQSYGKYFIGAPSPHNIAATAYGKRKDEKHLSATIRQILPCIIDAAPLPKHLVDYCIRHASKRNSINDPDWETALGVACALYKKQNKHQRNYQMALETHIHSRDYLYGRLLALADRLEEIALKNANEKRETNAGKLMQRFADNPYSTWLIIEKSLKPYETRLRTKGFGGFLTNIQKEMDEVMALFNREDFISSAKLSGEFLLGFHCQRQHLKKPSNQETKETIQE